MALSRAIKDSINAELTRQGMSQRELARRLGVRQPYLWKRVATGGRADKDFTPSELERIAEILNVPITQLIPTGVAV
jgi:transcriptional regulator with XRE-family HTH domain